jgi:formylglycine-generating enzyme required for sulfatase activity
MEKRISSAGAKTYGYRRSRVFRGGSWFSGARNCRSACRGGDGPNYCFDNWSFRPVAEVRR